MMTFIDFVSEYYGYSVDLDTLDEYEMYMLCKMYDSKEDR